MYKRNRIAALAAICAAVSAATSGSVVAQARSTPVQVQNPVAVDPNNNTVKIDSNSNAVKISTAGNIVQALQSGTWNVWLAGTPNVSVTNTPNVNVASLPAVSIDSVNNTVKTPTQRSTVQIWSTTQNLPAGAYVNSANINCAGYKEARICLTLSGWNSTSASQTMVDVWFTGLQGYSVPMADASFAAGGQNIATGTGRCVIVLPIVSDQFYISVYNGSTFGTSIPSACWVYLVN